VGGKQGAANISKTVADLLKGGERVDLVRQAIADARREGFIGDPEARQLQRRLQGHLKTVRAPQSQMEPAIP